MENYLSLKDHVYQYISERINDGTLKPFDKLSEAQVGTELNVSRTPVREALIRLSYDGYLENHPRKGFYVKSLDVKRVQQMYELIGLLDGRAAAITVNSITSKELDKMTKLADKMDAAINELSYNKYYELQVAFHNVYLDLCPNLEIINTLQKTKNSFLRKKYAFDVEDDVAEILHQVNKQHYTIINYFKEKNGEELEKFIRDIHWSKIQARFDAFEASNKNENITQK